MEAALPSFTATSTSSSSSNFLGNPFLIPPNFTYSIFSAQVIDRQCFKFNSWIIDTRATDHMVHSVSQLTTIVTTPPQLCRYCPLWGPYLSRFCSPSKHTAVGEKVSTHWRGVIPYKHISMCFPRWWGIPWNARPSFLGHYNNHFYSSFLFLFAKWGKGYCNTHRHCTNFFYTYIHKCFVCPFLQFQSYFC